ncbi:MAG: flagellar basal-body rod protein FlgF [Mesorhizobium sp.]
MQDSLYVTLSAQVALERRLTTIADNVANSSTVGFRATQIKFDDVLSGMASNPVAFVRTGGTYLSEAKGAFRQTGSAYDFAIRGDAWFSLETPSGQVVTKDGRFTLTTEGALVSVEGYPVLDPGGTPIQIDAAAGPITVSPDGFIRQRGQQVGALGLFSYQTGTEFRRYGNSGIVAERPPEPLVDASIAGVHQGYVEDSNVNPVQEMTRLIMVQRAFEAASSAIKQTESTFGEAVRTLGGRS